MYNIQLMIGPEEIKQQVLKWWKPFLQSYVHKEPFFPKQLERIGKIKSSHLTNRFEELQNEIEALYKHSKNETGVGYLIKTSDKTFRRTGKHELPDGIEFETLEDYVQFVGKKVDWKLFQKNFELIIEKLPQLKEWIVNETIYLTMPDINWSDILKVCNYFIDTPRPNLYLRQLPIEVHTKFIEDHTTLLQSLLDFLVRDHIRNKEQKRFAERYFLKYDEPLIRIRILDRKLAIFNNIMDISISSSDFEKTEWDCNYVLITENKMNFLALPFISSAIAIWSGGGFNVSYLKNAEWLKRKTIYYWGDIDEYGFQILHQIRSYYPQIKSMMMDKNTFNTFEKYAVNGERNKADRLYHLNKEEAELYEILKGKEKKNRLEQEKIPHSYFNKELEKVFEKIISSQ